MSHRFWSLHRKFIPVQEYICSMNVHTGWPNSVTVLQSYLLQQEMLLCEKSLRRTGNIQRLHFLSAEDQVPGKGMGRYTACNYMHVFHMFCWGKPTISMFYDIQTEMTKLFFQETVKLCFLHVVIKNSHTKPSSWAARVTLTAKIKSD